MSHYYKDCRTCGASHEERFNAIKDNGHTVECKFYMKKSETPNVENTPNWNNVRKFGITYD